jgi:ferrous iron transport protein B
MPAGAPRRGPDDLLVGLVGQPNGGKSTIFNLLTGLGQHVGNWPGTTLTRREGLFHHRGRRWRVVDLPGSYALTAHSAEELAVRDFLIHERPHLVVVVADASVLERGLYLMAELAGLGVPLVLALNMMDVARAQGTVLDPAVLEAALGIPAVPLVARRGEGIEDLLTAIDRVAEEPERFRCSRPEIPDPLGAGFAELCAWLGAQVPPPYTASWIAEKLLERDADVVNEASGWLDKASWLGVHTVLAQQQDALRHLITAKHAWIGRMLQGVIRRPVPRRLSGTDRIDRVAVHPLWGVLVLAGAFAFIFWITFTVSAPLQRWLDTAALQPLRVWPGAAFPSSPTWLIALISDGVLGGVGIILTFLPVLIVFFGAIALFEESGYLVRCGFLMDGCMRRVGLSGKSFLPLCLGIGCNVPAVLATRAVETPGRRLLTILLAPLVPCTGRLTVLAFLAPALFGERALLISCMLVAMNLLALALVGTALGHTMFRGSEGTFILELPVYHLPDPRTIARFVLRNVLAFLRNASSLILLVSIIVWAGTSFPGTGIEHSYLGRIGIWLAPVGSLMGLDWRLVLALASSLVVKENVIATLGVLYADRGPDVGLAAVLAEQISPASALSFLTVTMLFVPCAATVAAMRQELGSWRWPLASAGLLLALALGAGTLVYQGARALGAAL